ncbi:DUF72 domain-containing protein [Celerinatantimonas diazotrophica]
MTSADTGILRVGMAMWSHEQWRGSLYCGPREQWLEDYAKVFSTVEGNTTFYALPKIESVRNWSRAVGPSFRFTFKLPKSITHQAQLCHCQGLLSEFFATMAPIAEQTSVWMIQLPKQFGPQQLPNLESFLAQLPKDRTFGVEVRHPQFFTKGSAEQQLNQLLMAQKVERIMMDTRAVFAAPATTAAVVEAHAKKPHVPVHVLVAGQTPIIRFIAHPQMSANDQFFRPWLAKLSIWLSNGLNPHLFIHTPDNVLAPQFAVYLYQQLADFYQRETNIVLPSLELPESPAAQQIDIF